MVSTKLKWRVLLRYIFSCSSLQDTFLKTLLKYLWHLNLDIYSSWPFHFWPVCPYLLMLQFFNHYQILLLVYKYSSCNFYVEIQNCPALLACGKVFPHGQRSLFVLWLENFVCALNYFSWGQEISVISCFFGLKSCEIWWISNSSLATLS